LFRLGINSRHPHFEIVVPTKQDSMHHWKFSKLYTGARWQQAESIENHKNEYVCSIGQGKAKHRKYKRQ
jgi:hypothetical protein